MTDAGEIILRIKPLIKHVLDDHEVVYDIKEIIAEALRCFNGHAVTNEHPNDYDLFVSELKLEEMGPASQSDCNIVITIIAANLSNRVETARTIMREISERVSAHPAFDGKYASTRVRLVLGTVIEASSY